MIDKLADTLNKGLNEDGRSEAVGRARALIPSSRERRGPRALADLVKSESARLMPILRAAAVKSDHEKSTVFSRDQIMD